jgi:hypothetical protein
MLERVSLLGSSPSTGLGAKSWTGEGVVADAQ